jgi:hypothetical protein
LARSVLRLAMEGDVIRCDYMMGRWKA